MKIPGLSFESKERAIVAGILKEYSIVHESVLDFQKLTRASSSRDQAAVAGLVQKVLDSEQASADFRRSLSTEIAEGAFFGGVREDMLDLLGRLHDVADCAKGAARFIGSDAALDGFALALIASDSATEFFADVVGTVEALGSLLEAFELGRKEMMGRIPKVEEMERAADASKDEVTRALFAQAERPDPVTVIQMRDFLFTTDGMADRAQDASDVVLILVAKGYG